MESYRCGYMVSQPDTELRVSMSVGLSEIVDAINRYIDNNRTILFSGDNVYLGTWIDDSHLYLDISENVEDYYEAVTQGVCANQLAIYDVKYKLDIRLAS